MRRTLLLVSAMAIMLPAVAFAQAGGPPPTYTDIQGNKRQALPSSIMGTVAGGASGAPCLIGVDANCSLPVPTGSGGAVTANQGTPASSANAWPVTSVAAYATTTQSGFTTSGTPNTFTQLLASSTTRKSCTIQYTGTGTLLIFYGLTASATTTNSFQIQSGQTINCAGSFNPLGDAVNVGSATASDTGVYAVQ